METERSDKLLQEKARKQLAKDLKPIEKLRYQCLLRGASGIAGIGRQFRIIDDDGNKKLDFKEFSKGCKDFGVDLSKEEVKEIFDEIDTDQSGFIDFDEFLISLRPPMSKCRLDVLNKAFLKMDKTKDGAITIEDLKGVYNVKNHPKFINGEKTEDEILVEFLKTFQPQNNADEIVTREEFFNYYTGISASIDNDAYFDLMIRQAYKI
ncbi:calcyphosine/tpp, putative [Schistosoma mansoni]|uniref:calcyphosine/tpp, putative n=1 Tax=Schistosoma mansoni TaxID=6183 RepID=UPI0001A63466|nr:calcyphosine/tpp, putative [Schistosoma mansoni]|eukprot:XP_018645771.1 calcyphosine/tpp, putative [Schistosoma mansoni]